MTDDDAKAGERVGNGAIFQHLLVAITVAEHRDGALADELVDAGGLSRLVVDEQIFHGLDQHRSAVAQFIFHARRGADHLSRRDAIDPVTPYPHEIGAAA